MKRLFYLLLLLPILFVGCKKNNVQNEEPEAVKLAVEPNSIISPSAGADYTLTLTAPEAWTATCADSWVKVNPTSGNAGTVEISVKIAADKTSTEASSKIVFKSGDQTVEVPVKRLAKDPARLMIVSETDIQTPKDGGTYAIKVESNIKWQIASNASWAKIEGNAVVRNNGVISVTVEAATAPEETVATLTVSPLEGSGVEKQTVTITRGGTEATSMTIDKNQIDAPADGGMYSVAVTTTAQWKATKSWDADWLTISDNENTGSGSFSIKVDPATSSNDQSAVITVTEVRSDDYKPVQLNVLVSRKGKANATLFVFPTTINSPKEGCETAIDIKCNYPWTATTVGTFFSLSTTKGDGDATVVVTVKPTTDEKEVTGKIFIKSSYGGEQQTITIHRQAYEFPQLELSTYKVKSDFQGGKYTIKVTSNYSWQVKTSDPELVKLSATSGPATKGSFDITIPRTIEMGPATATVTVTTDYGNYSRIIEITREGIPDSKYIPKAFSVSPTKKVYLAPGNLQYNLKNDAWRFAPQQYECRFGDNFLRQRSDDNHWLDLFCWGTGNEPLRSAKEETVETFVDWGINKISYYGDIYNPNVWRTPTIAEWKYLFDKNRKRYTYCWIKLSDDAIYKGFVLLPDDWQQPSDVTLRMDNSNIYNIPEWQKLEAAGAIFFPWAGWFIEGEGYAEMNREGYYWAHVPNSKSDCFVFQDSDDADWRAAPFLSTDYCSVRLIRDAVE